MVYKHKRNETFLLPLLVLIVSLTSVKLVNVHSLVV